MKTYRRKDTTLDQHQNVEGPSDQVCLWQFSAFLSFLIIVWTQNEVGFAPMLSFVGFSLFLLELLIATVVIRLGVYLILHK